MTADYLASPPQPSAALGFLNDEIAVGETIGRTPVLGAFEDWPRMPVDVLFNAPLHKAKHMPARAARIRGLGVPETRWGSIVSALASVSPAATLGAGAGVGAFCTVMPDARIGRHVALRPGAFVGHDATIGDFAFLGGRAVVAGYCDIAEGAHVGPGAAVREHVRVGRFAVVGIGAVVIRDVADYEIVAGNPASRIGFLEEGGP